MERPSPGFQPGVANLRRKETRSTNNMKQQSVAQYHGWYRYNQPKASEVRPQVHNPLARSSFAPPFCVFICAYIYKGERARQRHTTLTKRKITSRSSSRAPLPRRPPWDLRQALRPARGRPTAVTRNYRSRFRSVGPGTD